MVSFPHTATVLLLTTCWRTWEQAQVCLVPGAFVSRPRCVRVTSQMRLCLDPDAFVSRPAFAESHYLFLLNNIYLCNKNELRMQRGIRFEF